MPFADMCWLKISAELQKIYRNNEVREEKNLGKKTNRRKYDHGGDYLEAASDIFLSDHAGNFNPTIIYNRGYDYRRTFCGEGGISQRRRSGGCFINDCCYIF